MSQRRSARKPAQGRAPAPEPAAEPEPATEPAPASEPAAEQAPEPAAEQAPAAPEPALRPGEAAHREIPQFTCVAPTKQPPELCCITCGAFLGHDRPLVQAVQAAWRSRQAAEAKCRLEYVSMLPNSTPVLGPLFDALGHRRDCCRSQLLSSYPHAGQRALPPAELVLPPAGPPASAPKR